MKNPALNMLEKGKITTEDLAEAINRHPGRETAFRDLVVIVVCGHCREPFPTQPQDARKQTELKERTFCFKRECRQELRRLQGMDRKKQKRKR